VVAKDILSESIIGEILLVDIAILIALQLNSWKEEIKARVKNIYELNYKSNKRRTKN
jgi:hypothetical protein